MKARFAVPSLIVTVYAGLFAAPAMADGEPLIDRYTETVFQVDTTAPDSSPRTLVAEQVVDRHGEPVSTASYTLETAAEKANTIRPLASPFACRAEGHRAGFTQHPMKEVYQGGKNRNDFVQFQFFPYSQGNARVDHTRRHTQQWLFCATGGIDSDNGSRLVISGPGVAYGDAKKTWKLGQVWKEGSTPANYSVSMGFETEGPVKVNGGVQQTPTSALKGSPRPPFKNKLDVFSRNGVNGWWAASCAPDCTGTGGSTNFQGSVVEGLWEFPQSMSVMVSDFMMAGWKKTFCANPFGCRP